MNTEQLKNGSSKKRANLTGKERLLFVDPNSAKKGTTPPIDYIEVNELINNTPGGDTYWEVADIGFGSTLTNIDKNTDILLLRGDLDNDFVAVYLTDKRFLVFNQNGTMISSRNINNIENTEITIPEYADDLSADADVNLENGSLYKLTGDRTIYQKP